MRVIGGLYGGRRLVSPKDRTIRPTSDKIKGSIFNALLGLTEFEGANVLDLFCGSGALGLEALSRGAVHAVFIDQQKSSLDLARLNAESLGVKDQALFLKQSCTALKGRPDTMKKAGVFFCDPPYAQDLIAPTLQKLHEGGWLQDGAVGVLESERNANYALPEAYTPYREKTYGDTCITYISYRG